MLIYNLTIKVDSTIDDEWLRWQKDIHIPEMLATGTFYDYRLFQLLDQDETEGKTYVIQYFANDKNDYDKYVSDYAPELRMKAITKWGEYFIAFRSLMKSV